MRLFLLFEEVKGVLSDVRWNYGPPSEVHVHQITPDE